MIIAVDRAGIVGEDGETHQGLFDVSLIQSIPDTTVYSPSTYCELRNALYNAFYKDSNLVVIRYPRGCMPESGYSDICESDMQIIGDENADTAIVTYGRLFFEAVKAAEDLWNKGISVKIIKLNRIKPIPENAKAQAAKCGKVYFFEEGMKGGGVGERFGCELLENGFKSEYTLTAVNDEFVAHASVASITDKYNLSAAKMAEIIEKGAAYER